MDPRRILLCAFALLAAFVSAASAAGFPEITPQERALTSVPNEPNASAVVLFKKGEFVMAGTYGNTSGSSTYSVQVRRKILTEEGKGYGEVAVYHSKWARLQNLKGRTVLPDGRVLPLSSDATFRRKLSQNDKRFVTSIAFPGVEVGAILDYQYEIRVDSIFFLESWYFQEEVPTLYSEIAYEIPSGVSVTTWVRDPMRVGLKKDQREVAGGGRLRVWGENLPAIPDEPFSLPYSDLSSRFMLVPTNISNGYQSVDLLKDWPSTCNLYSDDYEKALRKGSEAERKAKALTGAAAGQRAKAEVLYRFVRDQIETDPQLGIQIAKGSTADKVLAAQRGDYVDKTILLQKMLGAVGITAHPVWVAERDGGTADLQLPNPWWFDRAIIMAEVDGTRVFLDPSDRTLGFGRLAPGLEGTAALVYDSKKPEVITLPETTFDQHTRTAKVQLDLDAEGRLQGKGTLLLTGHPAWESLGWQDDAEKTNKAWKDWLAEEYPDYDITDLKVVEAVDDQKVEVTWAMAQREEEVLGDEATLTPSRPLGPVRQRFQMPAAKRVSPVLFDYPDRDEVQLSVHWPEGWKPEALPKAIAHASPVGAVSATVELDAAARILTYRRRFDLTTRVVPLPGSYQKLQTLYNEVEKHDAQALVLVRH
ncbi:MAG TPA: DUF3857 domain-containing protein [Thermoanaerobaculia bacterium]|nr:DUF3857 domain-containing protein [Thermoanaerobaculia bacterium]